MSKEYLNAETIAIIDGADGPTGVFINNLNERLEIRAVHLVLKGQMLLLTATCPLNFREMTVEITSNVSAKRTVDFIKNENADIVIQGRHDPCVVPRAVPVVESVVALALLDALLEKTQL